MRVALHIIETFKIEDPDIIAAALLHDILEDHATELVFKLTGEIIKDEADARVRGRILLEDFFNPRIAGIVHKVTTPLLKPGETKNQMYAQNVAWLSQDPEAEIVKLADTIDNAVGNHATQEESKQRKLDIKYIPVYLIHLKALYHQNSLIKGEEREKVADMLFLGQQRATLRMALLAINHKDDVTLAV